MTRDGVVLENQTTGEEINISDRDEEQDFTSAGATGRAEKVLERADRVQERRAGKRAAKQAGQVEADTGPRPSARLQFSEEERSTPELKKYIRKSDRRADRLDAARAAIPKETVKIKEKVFDEASGRAKTRVRRETRDKPPTAMKPNPASRPVQEVLLFTHGKIHERQIDNIPSAYPGYDEYRYDLDEIMHNPHELASFLTSILPRYTLAEVQAELQRVFAKQYTLTTTTTVEVRYRTETRTDSEGNSYTVQVPYNYYILNVKLTARSIASIAPELLTPEQLEMFNIYLETSGNNPLVFGGGSYDISASEDISGVHFVDGARPGNTAVVDIAKSQVGNVNGQPYWSWYGFDSRVAWCACFVSWCYNQAGLSEPRFSGCTTGGMAWFQSRGQWANRGYSDIAPGDAIFFDWDNSGNADHVGIVIGTDGTNVYTVEGNSGNACKIKSYPLNSSVIRGYGLMNWD